MGSKGETVLLSLLLCSRLMRGVSLISFDGFRGAFNSQTLGRNGSSDMWELLVC